MRISSAMAMASALLLGAGCAREQQSAHYDETISPAYSAGRTSDYDSDHKAAVSSPNESELNATAEKIGGQSDNSIVASVRELLLRNEEIAPIVPNIQISDNNGAVILNGSVQSQEQKRQIEVIAQQATGVVAINNQLDVITPPRQTTMENQPTNPLLNPTSVSSNSPPALYQNSGNGSSHVSRQNAEGKISEIQNGQAETTNSDLNTSDSPMR